MVVLLSLLAAGLGGVSAPAPASAGVRSTATNPALLNRRVGFAATVTGGAAVRPVKVTNCGDSPTAPPAGSLRAVLATPGAHYVKWAASCTTHLLAPLRVPSDTTLDGSGQTVTLTGRNDDHHGLLVDQVTNVIIHNLTLTDFGSPALRQFNDEPDGLSVIASRRVWIDHNTFANMGDKQLAVQTGSTDVTVSWNRFVGDAYNAQFFQIGSLFDGPSVSSVQNVTSHHNLYDGPGYRTPSIAFGTLHQFNDVIERWVAYGIHCQQRAQCHMENDVFVGSGASNGRVAVKYRPSGVGCNDAGTLCDPSWGAGTVVNPYLPVADTSATSSVAQAPCADPAVDPCSPWFGSGPATFTPAYDYDPEPADASLQARVEANAGSHVVARW